MDEFKSSAANEFAGYVDRLAGKMEELEAAHPYTKDAGAARQLQMLARKIRTLPEKELIEAQDSVKDMPEWHKLPEDIDVAIIKISRIDLKEPQEPSILALTRTDCTVQPCPGTTQEQVDNLLIGVASVELLAAGAQALADTLNIFKITELAAKIAQAVASGFALVAAGLALGAAIQQRAANLVAKCESDQLQALIVRMCNALNSIEAKIDKTIGVLQAISLKLDKLIELAGEIKEVVDEILLHQIEEALSECKMLTGLYLPESAFGSLTEVQNIVEELIYNSKLAGLKTANAQAYYRQGLIAASNGQYELALEWFMLSYKQLQDKEICKAPCPSDPCGQCGKC